MRGGEPIASALQLAVLDVMQGVADIVEHQLDMARRGDRSSPAPRPVGHVRHPDAGEDLEPLDRELLRASRRRASHS